MIEVSVSHGNIHDYEADTLIINLFEGLAQPEGVSAVVDRKLDGAISELITLGDFLGTLGEVAVLYPK